MATKHFENFLRSRGGNVAMITAVSLVPIMILTGAVVDYSRDLQVKTALQAAVDTASLNTARQSPGLTTDQMLAIAQKSVAAAFHSGFAGADPTTTLTYVPAGSSANAKITVTATVPVPATFTRLFGVISTPVSAASTSTWGNTRLRVALALDNTGSMDDPPPAGQVTKMAALKTATTNLLQSLQNASVTPGDVMVSIIPFAKVVNVGTSNVSASWISWTDWDSNNQVCSKNKCVAQSHSNWDGSIMDRDQNYDINNTVPTSSSTLFPAAQGVSRDPTPTSLLRMTYDWTALSNKVAAMTPVGGTNQQIGLAWAWQSLSTDSGSPLNAPAKDTKFTYADIIIILSDGLNTENRWYGNGTTYDARVDARQKLLCDNIKAAGVTIYAVQVNTDNAATALALQYCASDASKFTKLNSADQIITTFASIGASLSQLHLSR